MTGPVFRRVAILFATALALSPPIHAQSGYELFQQALSKERAEGKLQDAIALYQRVVEAAGADHGLAAKALLQLGRCYETLGNTEARTAYERLIARYPDQTDLVAQARARLAALARPSSSAREAMVVQPLSDVTKDGELVAVSPDGTKALVVDYGKGVNFAVYDFSKRQKSVLTNHWYSWFAIWSPDGRRVAYHTSSFEASELRVVTLDRQSTVVYRNDGVQSVQPVGWTPDGATIIAVVRRPDKTWVVGTLPATGGVFTALRSLGWSYDWLDGSPRLSPDGRYLAYLEGEKGLRDVHVVSLDGRDAGRITDHAADDFAPLWSPDGRRLAFASNRLGSVALWTIEVKDGKPVGQPVKLKDGMQSTRVIDWADRGIFYDQQTTSWDIYTVPMDPVEARPAGSPRLIPYSRTGRNVSPVWSPDGTTLAFISSTAAEPNRRYVVVMSPDGTQAREFLVPTTAWIYPQSPGDLRWFGDGRGLGLSGLDTRGSTAVFRLRLETGEWDTISLSDEERTILTAEWNRDGSAFYFARRGASGGIFERAVNADTERQVYRSPTPVLSILDLQFSADRKWLAFEENAAGVNNLSKRIIVVDVGTGETRTLLEEVAPGRRTSLVGWAPSGDLLVWRLGTDAAAPETLLVPVNGGAPRSIAAFGPSAPKASERPPVAQWSPEGRSMVLGRTNRGLETFVLENPLALLRSTTASR